MIDNNDFYFIIGRCCDPTGQTLSPNQFCQFTSRALTDENQPVQIGADCRNSTHDHSTSKTTITYPVFSNRSTTHLHTFHTFHSVMSNSPAYVLTPLTPHHNDLKVGLYDFFIFQLCFNIVCNWTVFIGSNMTTCSQSELS